MKMLKATVHHPGRARYWLRRRDTPTAVAALTVGFSDVGAFIGRRRKPQSANDEKFVVVLPLTTRKFARDTTEMETITVKQWPAGNGLPDFSVRKVANGAVEVVAGNYKECPRVENGSVVYARPELFPRPVKAAAYRVLKELGHVS